MPVYCSPALITKQGKTKSVDISIIIPAHNSLRFLADTFKSVQAQTVDEWELLLVENGSTDDTLSIAYDFARRDPRIRVLEIGPSNTAAARNHGLRQSNPETGFLMFLDHDDVLVLDALETLLCQLARSPKAPAAHGVAKLIDSSGKPIGEADALPAKRFKVNGRRIEACVSEEATSFAFLAACNTIATPGQALIRRSALEAAGLIEKGAFDPRLVPADDWDLWLTLARVESIAFIPEVVIGWRQHDGNFSRRTDLMADAAKAVRNRHLTAADISPDHRQLLQAGDSDTFWRLEWMRGSLAKGNLFEAARHLRHALRGMIRGAGRKPNSSAFGYPPFGNGRREEDTSARRGSTPSR